MGDLRNKLRKDMERAAHDAWMRKNFPASPAQPLPRCACGFTWLEVRPMWCIPGKDRWSPDQYACPSCLPAEYFGIAAAVVARTIDVEPAQINGSPNEPVIPGLDAEHSANLPKDEPEARRSEAILMVGHPDPGRYVVRRQGPKNEVITVCRTMYAAVEAAKREGRRIAAQEGLLAVVELEHPDGKFRPLARLKPKGWHLRD